MKGHTYRQAGFTLIELMIVVVVILVLAGGAIPAFFKFNQNQTVINDARQLSTEINRVRSLALTLQYPSGCVTLTGYNIKSVTIGGSLSGVSVTALCGSGNIVGPATSLLVGSVFSSSVDITFAPGTGYLNGGSDVDITIKDKSDASITKKITIGRYGTITVSNNNKKELRRWV